MNELHTIKTTVFFRLKFNIFQVKYIFVNGINNGRKMIKWFNYGNIEWGEEYKYRWHYLGSLHPASFEKRCAEPGRWLRESDWIDHWHATAFFSGCHVESLCVLSFQWLCWSDRQPTAPNWVKSYFIMHWPFDNFYSLGVYLRRCSFSFKYKSVRLFLPLSFL